MKIKPSTAKYRLTQNKKRLENITNTLGIFGSTQNVVFQNYLKNVSTKKTFQEIKRLERNVLSGKVHQVKRSFVARVIPELKRQASLKELKTYSDLRAITSIIERNEFYEKEREIFEEYSSAVKSKDVQAIEKAKDKVSYKYQQERATKIVKLLRMK